MKTQDRRPLPTMLLGLVLGLALGVVVAVWALPERITLKPSGAGAPSPAELWPLSPLPPQSLYQLDRQSGWRRLVFDEDGWSAGPAGTFAEVGATLDRLAGGARELVIPIFPTVYEPTTLDKLYYDAILQSHIQPGDKVLVIGTGSGADSWAASLKSQAPIYVVEINPMAVINAKLTAQLAGFEIKPLVGDFREVELPEEYSEFDYVLWNMPFVEVGATPEDYQKRDFHDGDDGDVLQFFLAKLPTLLKEDGVAIALNYALAEQQIDLPGVTTEVADDVEEITDTTFMLFTIPNPGIDSNRQD